MMFSTAKGRTAIITVLCLTFGLFACDNSEEAVPTATAPAVVDAVIEAPIEAVEEVPVARRAVLVETLPYAEIDEQLVYGYFSFPADMFDPLPAIIVIHDQWGLDEPIRDITRRLAADGFIVVAIDLFGGKATESISEARLLEIEVFENPELAVENILQAHQFLKNTFCAPAVATVGLGVGGGWSFNAATMLPTELYASVVFYGQVSGDQEKLSPIQAPVLGLFAENDRVVPADTAYDFEAGMRALGKKVEVELFAGAGHGFADTHSENYDAEIAERAWQQTLDFLQRSINDTAE
jgi:carboxymethylenebutenolidase